jgi:hypothetical protein
MLVAIAPPESRNPFDIREEAMSTALMCLTEPDRALAALAAEIRDRHRAHLRALRIDTVRGALVIRGVATSFYGKQLALSEIRRRCSLTVVANEVEVLEPAGGRFK